MLSGTESSRVSRAELLVEVTKVEATERPEEVRIAQESKKLAGTSKMERCRFSLAAAVALDDVVVVVRGGSDAMNLS